MRYLFLTFILFTTTAWASPQDEDKEISDHVKWCYSKASFEIEYNKDYPKAVEYLLDIMEEDSLYADALYMLTGLYMELEQEDEALIYFKRVRRHYPDDLRNLRGYSSVVFQKGNYQLAKEILTDMKKAETDPDEAEHYAEVYKEYVDLTMASVDLALRETANPKEVNRSAVEAVNTELNEYFPTLTVDQQTMIVTRKVGTHEIDKVYRERMNEDLFVSYFDGEEWSSLKSLSPVINTPANEGAQSLSSDGRELFFTSAGKKDCLGSTDIYVSEKLPDGTWSEPRNCGSAINSQHWDTQPCISNDGKTLYFVSDRPGGIGKSDIWFSTRDQYGTWSEAQLLDGPMNTKGVEYSPFLSFDGKNMYFASDGHPTLGGMDLYVTQKQEDGSWGTPVNMGYPINSVGHQVGLFVAADGRTAYYADDKIGNNSEIYTFELPQKYQSEVMSFVKGLVFNSEDSTKISTKLKLYNSRTKEEVLTSESDLQSGEYLISLPVGTQYTLEVEEKDYFKYSKNFFLSYQNKDRGNTINIGLKPQVTTIELASNTIDESSKLPIQASIVVKDPSGNVFFETVADSNGTAKFMVDKRTSYTIEVGHQGYDKAETKFSPGQNTQLNFALNMRPSVIELATQDLKSQKALGQVTYEIFKQDSIVKSGQTDATGLASLQLMFSEGYSIQLSALNYKTLKEEFVIGVDTTKLNFALELNLAPVTLNFVDESNLPISTVPYSLASATQEAEDYESDELGRSTRQLIIGNAYTLTATAPGFKQSISELFVQAENKAVTVILNKEAAPKREIAPEPAPTIVEKVAVEEKPEPVAEPAVEEVVEPVAEQVVEEVPDEVEVAEPEEIPAVTTEVEETPEPEVKEDMKMEFYMLFSKVDLVNASSNELQKVDLTGEKYYIDAHADTTGPAAYNMWLTQKRAEAFRDLLISMGVSADKIEIRWHGETKPKYKENRKNRRIELNISWAKQ